MEYGSLLRDFIDDAEGHLSTFDDALLTLERQGHDTEIVLGALGTLHTLKGNAGMMGFESLQNYLHLLEDILKKVNDGDLPMGLIMGALMDSANVLRSALQGLGRDPVVIPDLTDNILALQRGVSREGGNDERPNIDPAAYLGAKTDTIRVDFKKFDDLLGLVGELLIFKTRLNQLELEIRAAVNNKPLIKELHEGIGLMGRTVAGLQEGIMRARMLPVRHVFNKFRRMVRDLAESQGKGIQLVCEGEDTEIDKTVIDELEEPLLHIIRNAIDHGLEAPGERIGKGKSRQGMIRLSAAQESNYVVIRVGDDGRGIDIDKVRETALRQGLLKAGDSAGREEILSLIFSPGFTTKKEVSDISGRGIGLDVVSRNVARLNGQISVDSSPERGTEMILKLPLSLAIIPALMTEVDGKVYAVPMSAVEESVKVRDEDIHIINNHEVIRFREKLMPVVRLDEYYGLNRARRDRLYLVILGKGEKRLALAVDRLRGQQEIVIKPLDDTFGKPFGVAGASLMGDGTIVLIVDVMEFWNSSEVMRPVKSRHPYSV